MDLIARAQKQAAKLGRKLRGKSSTSNAGAAGTQQHSPAQSSTAASSRSMDDDEVSNGSFAANNAAASAEIRQLVAQDVVDLDALRRVGWFGAPSDCRMDVWCLLSDYWPPTRSNRDAVVARRRSEYRAFLSRHYNPVDWSEILESHNGSYSNSISDVAVGSEDVATMRQVRKDVPRTANSVAFITCTRMQLMLERLLFIWAVRHPASGYVQGMNDLALPFIYVAFANCLCDAGEGIAELLLWSADEVARRFEAVDDAAFSDIEADCYWLTSTFLSSVQDNFTFNQAGTHAMVSKMSDIINVTDPALSMHLQALQIQYPEFAFRWMNCFLLRELSAVQAVRLWDTYLCEQQDYAEMHVYVCAAMLRRWSDTITRCCDYVSVLHFLQSPPTKELDRRGMDELCSSAYLLQQLYQPSLGRLSGGGSEESARRLSNQ